MRIRILTLAFAALALGAPQIASAHTELVSTIPAANARVASPTKIELHFEEPIVGSTARAEIAMTGMPGTASHDPTAVTGFTSQMSKDKKTMTLQLRHALAAGTYKVTWSAAGADSHRAGGNFSFTVR
ncbi:copper homeostasis periplasmic binding protein CopC [Altererythrobacter sp. Root672]|uniref:copper homeostasis periplasmic binding protein CopC n=1 Tax=Altererythrobacter sp. Root672 TaxID=1736584 RepID=UPI0006F271C9|nr:copper homeostasis periplasmic binding protein CopC [Altererythrobacter sp. Root672]KRA81248.1 copper resistance protein CopC [Altererythrobacter sp. Root672]